MDIAPCGERIRVRFAGRTVADSTRALTVRETGYGPVHYIPPADVAADRLTRTGHRTRCPHKGEASYWTLTVDGHSAENAAWSYEDPLPGVAALKGCLAFYPDRVDGIDVGD